MRRLYSQQELDDAKDQARLEGFQRFRMNLVDALKGYPNLGGDKQIMELIDGLIKSGGKSNDTTEQE